NEDLAITCIYTRDSPRGIQISFRCKTYNEGTIRIEDVNISMSGTRFVIFIVRCQLLSISYIQLPTNTLNIEWCIACRYIGINKGSVLHIVKSIIEYIDLGLLKVSGIQKEGAIVFCNGKTFVYCLE